MREYEVCGPGKVLLDDISGGQRKFHTGRLHGSHVSVFVGYTAKSLGHNASDKVEVVSLIGIERQEDAVVDETEVCSHIELMLLFVCEFGVLDGGLVQ